MTGSDLIHILLYLVL